MQFNNKKEFNKKAVLKRKNADSSNYHIKHTKHKTTPFSKSLDVLEMKRNIIQR